MIHISCAQPRTFYFYCYDVREALTIYLSLTQMFQLPSVITMSIAATRIYRNLADFVHEPTDMCFFLRLLYLLRSLSSMICRSFDSLQIRDDKITKTKWKPSAPTSQIEVTVDTRCERHSTAQSIISVDGQQGDKPHRSSLDSDLETAMENPVPR
jgi:hypothetical protein